MRTPGNRGNGSFVGGSTADVVRKGVLFLRLTRPIFLVGGALLYAFGAAAAAAAGWSIDWGRYLMGQLMVTCIQLFAQYTNEYFDFEADRLNGDGRTWFSGGSGILPGGELARETALYAARVTGITALAFVFGIAFEHPIVALIGLAGIAGSWFYSAPPVALVGSGLGEWVSSGITSVFVPLTGALLQTGSSVPIFLFGMAPLFFFHAAMLVVFALPDVEADRQAGKGTIVVRIGRFRASVLHHALTLLGYTLVFAQSAFTPGLFKFVWGTLPLALWQIWAVSTYVHHPEKNPNRLTFGAIALFSLFLGLSIADLLILK